MFHQDREILALLSSYPACAPGADHPRIYVPAMSHGADTRWNQMAEREQDERSIYHLAEGDTH